MNKLKEILIIITGALILGIGFLYFVLPQKSLQLGAPTVNYQKSLLPITNSLYDLGTTTSKWNRLFTNYASTTALTITGTASTTDLIISGTCTGCGSAGAGDVFAWTPTADGNSTSTRLIFGNGFISQASSSVGNLSLINATTTSLSVSGLLNIGGDYLNELCGTGLTCSGNTLALNATGDWTGTIDGNNFAGGAIGVGELIYGGSAGSFSELAVSTNGYVLALSGGIPAWVASTTLSTITGTLTTDKGGTNQTSWTLGDVVYVSATDTLTGTTTANLKTTLKLNLVENTALSTWAGSANITTLGTIGTGVWSGTTITNAKGGTGQDSSGWTGFAGIAGGTWSASTSLSKNYIEDSYLFNTGDIGTGVYDFGGSSSLELPNGASPTVDALGECAIDSTSGQLKCYTDEVEVFVSERFPVFGYATSTAWTGTTTLFIGPASLAQTWENVKCETDAGTLNVSVYDGTNRMNLLNASTTIGTFKFSTNNSFTASESRRVDFGTPASNPTKITCTSNYSIDAD